ncbi:MAG: hypothetical protein QY325_08810 [Flavobacteriales bacterium]|nr:MAG: hypothetical protein QY325_08810 [Flavobacteriales bacterium]
MQQYPDLQAERDLTDERIHQGFRNATAFWNRFPAAQSDWQERKPFNQGEYNHYTQLTIPNPNFPNLVLWRNDVEKILHNYDVSFHNELWSSAFSGKFAAGTTWHWERVFWWPDRSRCTGTGRLPIPGRCAPPAAGCRPSRPGRRGAPPAPAATAHECPLRREAQQALRPAPALQRRELRPGEGPEDGHRGPQRHRQEHPAEVHRRRGEAR